mgnify:CR=1 FL=1
MGFGPIPENSWRVGASSLNALTGIDGIWTDVLLSDSRITMGLNALTGIDGIWTYTGIFGLYSPWHWVLMPLRALMGFGLNGRLVETRGVSRSLNALTGIDGIWTKCAGVLAFCRAAGS